MAKGKNTGTSPLLINEVPLQVLPSLATAVGLNEAIILQQIHYWLLHNPHERDGKLWTYNSYEDWKKQFPFWSIATIKRAVYALEEQQLITTTEQYNRKPIDKTKWYTINYDTLNMLCGTTYQNATSQIDTTLEQSAMSQNAPTSAQVATSQIDQLVVAKCTDGRSKMSHRQYKDARALRFPSEIPSKIPEESSPIGEDIAASANQPPSAPKYSTAFERFWHEYPVKKEKREAWKKWRAQKLDAKADMVIQSVIAHRSRDPSWKEGFIPYAQKYLGRQRWEDELPDQEHAMTWEAQSQAAIAKAYAEGTPYDAR